MKAMRWMAWCLCAGLLMACAATGPVRRVSEPSARIQQLTVQADGAWSAQLRLENFSSVAMRFDAIDLALRIGEHAAGRLQATPGVSVGPESADVITVPLQPDAAAKLALADALAAGRSITYSLTGELEATPQDGSRRSFDLERTSALSPAPGLPGVLR